MALGKNIEKKKLIPEAKKSKAPIASKPAGTKTKKSTKKVRVESPVENYISSQLSARKEALKIIYDHEIQELKDKTTQFIAFTIGKEEYAVEIGKVKKVVSKPEVSKVPNLPEYFKGVVDIKGRTFVAIDLADKFGLDEAAEANYAIIVDYRLGVCLLLAELPMTISAKGAEIFGPAELVEKSVSDKTYLKGLIKKEGRILFYLDIEELLQSEHAIVVPEELINQSQNVS